MFQHTKETADIFNSMIQEYAGIESDGDLEKAGIEYNEYKYSGLFMDMLRFNGSATTEYKGISEWCKRHGCFIKEIEGGWLVKLKEDT